MKKVIIIIFLLFSGLAYSNSLNDSLRSLYNEKEKIQSQFEKLIEKIHGLETELAVSKKGDENISSTLQIWEWAIAIVLGLLALMLVVSWINVRNVAREQARQHAMEQLNEISEPIIKQLETTKQQAIEILDEIKRILENAKKS